MSKKIFITGEAKTTSLLRSYISDRMSADFYEMNDFSLTNKDLNYILTADIILLVHELGSCDEAVAERNLRFTQEIICTLPLWKSSYTIVTFVPRYNVSGDIVRELKAQGEKIILNYCTDSGSRAILYRMPEVYGVGFENGTLNRLICDGEVKIPHRTYELLHSEGFLNEIYRAVNGAAAMTGYGWYAHPAGAYQTTEADLLRRFTRFGRLKKWQIPDLSSTFESFLYDYYLMKKKPNASYKLKEGKIISTDRVGSLYAVRLAPEEEYRIRLDGVSGLRVILLCGSIKIGKKVYCGDEDVLRIDINRDKIVKNIGESIAVIEVWSHKLTK